MHEQAAAAYQTVAKATQSPRDLESSLLSKAAGQLQRIQENWDERSGELSAALMFNRRIWTVFVSAVTADDSPLPLDLRENVANLGLFVLKRILETQAEPSPDKLTSLISINRQVAMGLRQQSEAA